MAVKKRSKISAEFSWAGTEESIPAREQISSAVTGLIPWENVHKAMAIASGLKIKAIIATQPSHKN